MLANPALPLTDRFARLLQCLFNAMSGEWRRRAIGHKLETAISARIHGLVRRLNAVFVKWRAGTLRPPLARNARTAPQPRAPHPASLLPRRFGWLKRLLPDSVSAINAFQAVLNDAEMQAIVAAAPQVGSILRPFCHFLGLATPPGLALPKRQRAPRPRRKNAKLPPHPLAAGFPDTQAARSAARALARMQAGLPVDTTRLSAVALGYFLHPPRNDHCPPPRIGYARSRWRPPKDYRPPDDWN